MKHALPTNRGGIMEGLDARSRQRLDRYVALLAEWKGVTNLISDSAFREIWGRHIPDGLRLYELFPTKLQWLDIGSGAGLPAIVVSALIADRPEARVYCIESDGRKCAFLRNVARELRLPMKVLNTRAEAVKRGDLGPIEIVTAKAFASISHILKLADPFLAEGATIVLPRGEGSRSEIEELDRIRYESVIHHGPARDNGFFLEIRRGNSRS